MFYLLKAHCFIPHYVRGTFQHPIRQTCPFAHFLSFYYCQCTQYTAYEGTGFAIVENPQNIFATPSQLLLTLIGLKTDPNIYMYSGATQSTLPYEISKETIATIFREFLILDFRRVLNIVNFLYGNSPASSL